MGYQPSSQKPTSTDISILVSAQNGDAISPSYIAWLEKHASAIATFEGMMEKAKDKQIVVFLDYDGTLSPIVEDPDRAYMFEKMRIAVHEIAKIFPTAIVSGRSLAKVKGFVQLDNVIYAGSHGMDISTPSGSLKYGDDKNQTKTVNEKGNEVFNFQPAHDFLPKIQEIKEVLQEKIKDIKGASIEDNKFCISVHYRRVHQEEVDNLKEIVKSTMDAYPNFCRSEGKKVVEVRPMIDWDKGRALDYLLDTLGFGNSTDFLPMYIGDDKTDEDAFKVIKSIGRGYPIVVSSTPKETNALYSLQDTDEVMNFLMELANWGKSSSAPNGLSDMEKKN
ncbi:probable trehalose-phosphate phosphatase D [Carica papaya]|uniref:probable trehalose-phosphate phosphatase D n=1 Tax=Carica papaya TaxID=3649 RepID=UPI000B8C736E|nr:probable trehalose-phosphate phosphatase D [Carica papaya]